MTVVMQNKNFYMPMAHYFHPWEAQLIFPSETLFPAQYPKQGLIFLSYVIKKKKSLPAWFIMLNSNRYSKNFHKESHDKRFPPYSPKVCSASKACDWQLALTLISIYVSCYIYYRVRKQDIFSGILLSATSLTWAGNVF